MKIGFIRNMRIEKYTYDTIVVGSGCAGLNAIDLLYEYGKRDIALITEGMKMGTSRNTGSDKQTYYKLTVSGNASDSVEEMAKSIFKNGSTNGDIALSEAASSLTSFYRLVSIGVPFPHNEYGEFVGYKTDHDPRMRATSCGPLTSKFMTEALEKSVLSKDIKIFDGYRVIKIIKEQDKAVGIICISRKCIDENNPFGLSLFLFNNIIFATGGPSSIYDSTVYPISQTCSHGVAFEAGARAINLTESQYGIASTKFRWNLSGTYQQVLPRYFYIDESGKEVEFLDKYFENTTDMLEAIFLKGYEWPFDPRKIYRNNKRSSSFVDIAIFNETSKNHKVFMDFRHNPSAATNKDGSLDISKLPLVAKEYLEKSNALLSLPIERLKKMNTPAIKLYKSHNIDLENEPLEIGVCAQHNNGGIDIDIYRQNPSLKNFYAVGECSGAFGIYRPGGTALNDTQVGSMMAAKKIASVADKNVAVKKRSYEKDMDNIILSFTKMTHDKKCVDKEFILNKRKEYGKIMDSCGAFIRCYDKICDALDKIDNELSNFERIYSGAKKEFLYMICINRDILITQKVYLSTIKDYIENGGKSRGSYLITNLSIDEILKTNSEIEIDKKHAKYTQVSILDNEMNVTTCFEKVRPIPKRDLWFENVYNKYLDGSIIK